jgi:methyl coenzyme M reductase beta subunit
MYACKMVNPTHNACIKEIVNDIEVSIALDDSCGCLVHMSRGDIRVYKGLVDLTDVLSHDCFDNAYVITATIENLITVYNWCKIN